MLALKDYQSRALDALRRYLARCTSTGKVSTAFYETTEEVFGQGVAYRPVADLPGLPYVCLRLPTGGGKTLLASHAVGLTAREFLHVDHPVVLWLVPSNAIKDQTLKALRDRWHPYRQAIEAEWGSVAVLDVEEALYVTRSTLDSSTTLIVTTMQAFRVEDTNGRKVYESAGALMEHFAGLDHQLAQSLEKTDGVVAFSLANVLRLRRPIVIVDEAHNARTGLSFETLARFRPSAILEFTATPDRVKNPSNVLYSASAAELNAEDMIKLPIRLEARPAWKELLADAVRMRRHLEDEARLEQQQNGEYLRPILLIQAQARNRERTSLSFDVVKSALIDDNQIPEDHIVVATGDERGLDGVDLFDRSCPVRFVITVQALREGWDCSFAYVLCSVAPLSSPTQVEQILGRILRLPKATRKQHEDLNRAYAYVTSPSFAIAAKNLTDALVENGFGREEARDAIGLPQAIPVPLFGTPLPDSSMTPTLPTDIDRSAMPVEIQQRLDVMPNGQITFRGVMEASDRDFLVAACPTIEGKELVERAYRQTRPATSVEDGAAARPTISVPVLAYRQGNLVRPFEETAILDRPWTLTTRDALLTNSDFPTTVTAGQVGEITVTRQGAVTASFVEELQQHLVLVRGDRNWTVAELVDWLDRHIVHPDITAAESGIFLTRVIRALMDQRNLPRDILERERFRLRTAVTAKIEQYRRDAHSQTFQSLLYPEDTSPIVVDPKVCFTFDPDRYPCNTRYAGSYRFQKHYYSAVGNLQSDGEEFECAQFLDMLPKVKVWVRNLERCPGQSFWLQTSTDRFYPDFVCMLNDGRILVVEYKGEDRWSNDDSKEKRDLGELWAKRSGGTCLFVMPKGKKLEEIREAIGQ